MERVPSPASPPEAIRAGKKTPRILMYSHDTYGLGHIRRSRAIANALVGAHGNVSVLIISGSALAGSFNFAPGIDFVHVPGIAKSENGSYGSANLRLDLAEVTAIRESLIRQTAESFRPDIFIADKEPAGFRGELVPSLKLMGAMGTRRIIGVRDVLDSPEIIRAEWHDKGAVRAMTDYYDDVLVYGSEAFYRPLDAMPMPADLHARIVYTGYLRRSVPVGNSGVRYPRSTKGPFILVTTGGGADGAGLIDWVISAYEANPDIPLPAVIAFGPFLSNTQRSHFQERIDRLSKVDAIVFDPKIEQLMSRATAVVAMGGYNTFCEILSFDKPALLVPRSRPRQEQLIRATRAEQLGLMRMLVDPVEEGAATRDPQVMARALEALAHQKPPSQAATPGMLDGLASISNHLAPYIEEPADACGASIGLGG
ncbi:putative glycosyltransferase [Angulomicrobium tetraedrale]|uniref:Putative glycosyltransferase n=1 Tax=Ancylobacter tetraedralis TaxID=217068 RepID=A0A839ZCQ6_9HYPH|nr:glycosyltransferase [Ancylobacter tetraedralis]MBB3772620.1 putative glycosyltransferase [Ancylobacter tetraedralis]